MTDKKVQEIVAQAIAETPMESWKYYHVCWWEGTLQCLHVHHTTQSHPSFYAASGGVFTDGLNVHQWRLVTDRVKDFCRRRGITLRDGQRQRGVPKAGVSRAKLQITQFDSLRLHGLIADGRSPESSTSPRLAKLERLLESARTVASEKVPGDVVTMNSQIRLKDDRKNEEITCSLVFPWDARSGRDPRIRNVSVLSPIGVSLLGRRVGHTINGHIRVDEVLYQPEAAGDYHL
jgi:regulator of nucleoside diphosphate kinase